MFEELDVNEKWTPSTYNQRPQRLTRILVVPRVLVPNELTQILRCLEQVLLGHTPLQTPKEPFDHLVLLRHLR